MKNIYFLHFSFLRSGHSSVTVRASAVSTRRRCITRLTTINAGLVVWVVRCVPTPHAMSIISPSLCHKHHLATNVGRGEEEAWSARVCPGWSKTDQTSVEASGRVLSKNTVWAGGAGPPSHGHIKDKVRASTATAGPYWRRLE